ncbi:ATP-dependent RNA helicase [Flavipsychrobacter stenotrophus]|uniref:ATP-dependent RNA helicase n=1 Tax=Flavipsychrobacter stenotrophus TaxID=2077091 RepID=A0A2S7SVW0_9BACT|nr:DEAD/DEAH box helicase [Flavipsychrobacter stenotrophus]PQJ11059.1 ATP-dependent RNA helicase [Flavipsychrobacter stenotrophus]
MDSFSSFPMREELKQALADLGFETPTPIQQKVIPYLLSEPKDIIGLAQTGTGKTAAYGLPLLHHTDVNIKSVQCLVLSPTRELCMQIQTEMQKYGSQMRGLRIAAVYGGVPIMGQIRDVRANPQVIVATPGRLIDLLERKAISLESLQYVVLDEADEMLNMGFREDIELILKNTPAEKKTWLFSATMSNDVRNIAKRFMKEWQEFSVAAANVTNENIDHQYFVANHHNRFETLRRLLDFAPGIYGIIFTRTKQDCQEVSEKLMKMGYHVSPLHGDMDQKMRSKVMERFKSRQLQAIVATDVAARGIDVNDITHVINYELPDDPEVYTHRSGRTARAGKSGICMSIVSPKQIGNIRQIERLVKQKFHKTDIPDGAEVVRKRLFFYMEQIANAEPKDEFAKIYYDSMHDQFANVDKDELIRKLIWLQLKDTIDAYSDSEDLNAGFERKGGAAGNSGGSRFTRLFINLGEKDGLNSQRLLQFITESTDIEANMIDRITVRDMSSFFNVPTDAAEYIKEHLSNKKFKTRKVRLEEADQPRGGSGGEGRPYAKPGGGGRFTGERSYGSRPPSSSGGSYGGSKGRSRSRD